MNNNFTTTALLIQYLDGELDGSQQEAMKKNIETNKAIREELENLRLTKEAIKSYGLKNKVNAIHTAMMSEIKMDASSKTGVVRNLLWYSLRIAALIIFVTGSFILFQYFSASPQKLFSENFHAFTLRQTRGTAGTPLQYAYKKENMQEVIQQFALLKDPQAEDYFLTGNAFLRTGQPLKAIENFAGLQQKNKKDNTDYFEEDTEYYLALSYIANSEPAKAILLFKKINTDINHPYHQKVTNWFITKLQHLLP